MVAEKAQPDDRESQLDEVIASYLEALETGAAPDRNNWLQRYPHLANELAAFFADEACFDGLMAPLRGHTPTPRSGLMPPNGRGAAPEVRVEPATAVPARGFGDYEILEEAARGGMGIVYRVRQRSLNRIVALKVIRDAEWATPQDIHRFRLEAEAVAQLDHPNIVPVYEVGEWRITPESTPVHYFSMKWIDGGTLGQLLASGRWSATERAGQQAAARLLAKAARAVHYAHERGLLHRDLKPANIMLQGDKDEDASTSSLGIPMIADFGLAKRVTVDDRLTQSGVAVGTPSYMAPEQASPGNGQGSTASTMAADVYSLGAILYEMLTGQPPFRGLTMLDTLREVLEREPERPGALNPSLDRDLETICLKCLQKDPAQRYASAAALGEDLERFLSGEPIQARPVGSAERVWRWCRRNPIPAITGLLAAVALMAALTFLTVIAVKETQHAKDLQQEKYNVQVALSKARLEKIDAENHFHEAERQRAEAERQRVEAERQHGIAVENLKEAERQRQLAEHSFRQAHQAVHVFYLGLAGELRRTPGLQTLRKKLLEAGLGYYEKFLTQRKDDPNLKRELADAQLDVGLIRTDTGSRVEAAKAFRAALAIYEELLKANPTDVNLRFRTANAGLNLGLGLSILGQSKDALALQLRTRGHYEALLRDRPGDARALSGLCDSNSALGSLYRGAGRLTESSEAFSSAVAVREQLANAQPHNPHQQDALALCYNNLGVIQVHLGRKEEALASFKKALAIRERRAQGKPNSAGLQLALAASYRDIGLTVEARNRKEALDWLSKARTLRMRVASANPNLMLAQTDLANSHLDVGTFLRASGKDRYAEAMSCFEQARAILEKMVKIDPVSPYLRRDLGNAYYTIANLHRALNNTDRALAAFAKARMLQEKLVADAPERPGDRSALANTFNNMALALFRKNLPDQAREMLQQAIQHQKQAIAGSRQSAAYRRHLATHYAALTEIELKTGRLAEAVAAAQERQRLWPGDPRVQYAVAADLAQAAGLVGKGKASLSAAEKAERTRYAGLAMAALRQAVAAGFRDRQRLEQDRAFDAVRQHPEYRKLLAELRE